MHLVQVILAGVTPNGVRTDILDKPPAPHLEPTPSSMPRKPKPWEQEGLLKSPALPGALHSVSSDHDFTHIGVVPDKGTTSRETGTLTEDNLTTNVGQERLAHVRHFNLSCFTFWDCDCHGHSINCCDDRTRVNISDVYM